MDIKLEQLKKRYAEKIRDAKTDDELFNIADEYEKEEKAMLKRTGNFVATLKKNKKKSPFYNKILRLIERGDYYGI